MMLEKIRGLFNVHVTNVAFSCGQRFNLSNKFSRANLSKSPVEKTVFLVKMAANSHIF